MRMLFGPIQGKLPEIPGHQLWTFGEEGCTIAFSCVHDSWDTLLARARDAGMEPDVIIWWLPEEDPFPEGGPRACPVPVVAMVSDWNIKFASILTIARNCACTLIDRAGAEVLRRQGVTRVYPWRIYANVRRPLHRLDLARTIDICFVGNLNPTIHAERSRFLRRLAALAGRYYIRILSGVYGQAYEDTLAQSKIVFNHSVRGEMNVRCYEAAGCGALLFIEASNLEVGQVLRHGRECVRYDEYTFERLLDYYLSHDEEREQVAAAGYERIKQERVDRRWAILTEMLAGLQATGALRWPLPSGTHPDKPVAERLARVHAALEGSGWGRYAVAEREAQAVAREHPHDGRVLATVARLATYKAADEGLPRATQEQQRPIAESLLRQVVAADARAALAGRALAYLALEAGATEEAATWFQWVDRALVGPAGPSDLTLPLYPRHYDTFRVQWERAVTQGDRAAQVALLRWDCALQLGHLAFAAGDHAAAARYLSQAIGLRPDLPEPYFARSDLRHELGLAALALADEREGHKRAPLHVNRWAVYAERLLAAGQPDGAAAFCRESITALGAFDSMEGIKAGLQGLLEHAEAVARPGI